MAASRNLISTAVLLVLLVAIQAWTARSQTCSSQLSRLNVCAPYVVPGLPNTTPNSACCTALRSVGHDCICSTLRIASQLPSQCNLPPASCGGQ